MQKQLLFDTQVKTFQSYLNEQLKKLVMSHAADKSLDKSQPSVKTRPVKTYPGPVQQVNNPGNVIFSSVLPFITDKWNRKLQRRNVPLVALQEFCEHTVVVL